MMAAGVPALLCTAVSTMRLWAMRTMMARVEVLNNRTRYPGAISLGRR